jgi:hypothetical protein
MPPMSVTMQAFMDAAAGDVVVVAAAVVVEVPPVAGLAVDFEPQPVAASATTAAPAAILVFVVVRTRLPLQIHYVDTDSVPYRCLSSQPPPLHRNASVIRFGRSFSA